LICNLLQNTGGIAAVGKVVIDPLDALLQLDRPWLDAILLAD